MKKYILIFLSLFSLFQCQISEKPTSNLLLHSSKALHKVKKQVEENDPFLNQAVEQLLNECEFMMDWGDFSVMYKEVVPPSGDKHDYYSFGPYWWPDPTKADGLPYIRRDGELNPETRSDKFDKQAMRKMVRVVKTLALAWFLTEDDRFAWHASTLIDTWFLHPETRMNPHLEYGQAIPGVVDGRGIGIIETVDLVDFLDALILLESSAEFTPEIRQGMKTWFKDYLNWLLTSQHGIDEDNWYNNHAVWYDVQVAAFALYTGQDSIAVRVCEASKTRRIQTQIEPDGRMEHELKRTRSMHYSIYNVRAFFKLATLGAHAGVDLWQYETEDGRGMRDALDFIIPYLQGKDWPYPQIKPFETAYGPLEAALRMAVNAYQDSAYHNLLRDLNLLQPADSFDLLFPINN